MLVYLQAGQLSIHFKGKQQYSAKAISHIFKDTVLKRYKEKKTVGIRTHDLTDKANLA